MEYHFYGWEQADAAPVNAEYDGIADPRKLYDLLSELWCADTCAPRMRASWTKENRTVGQCSITAFLVQDIFGGKVYGILRPGGNYHCYNVVRGQAFDLTSEQFGDEVLSYEDNPEQFREVHFAKEEKRLRYERLKAGLQERLRSMREEQGQMKMERLSYEALRKVGYEGYLLGKDAAPVRVLQFGEGNFLRAFVDYWFDMSNERAGWNGRAALVQPIAQGLAEQINAQEGLYTLYLRGSEKGEKISRKRVISVVDACYNAYVEADWQKVRAIACSGELEYIVSNTTEAGIVYDPSAQREQRPPVSFPAKLTALLYDRFLAGRPGVTVLSCELIDDNGRELKNCVERHACDWGLGEEFLDWIRTRNLFCSTLVDRIVPGRVRDPRELADMHAGNGYIDELIDVGELFGVWYIEGPQELEDRLPFRRAGLNVHVVPDVAPYKKRKVRILNGAHTGFVPGAYLAGFDIVRDCMQDEVIHGFMNRLLFDEVIPILPLEEEDCRQFAAAVTDRFNNPFIDHQLLSICLNTTSKWRTRDLPSLLEYQEHFGRLPEALCMGFAAAIAFYSNDLRGREEGTLIAARPQGDQYRIQDDEWVLDFYWEHRGDSEQELVHSVLSNENMWGQDLRKAEGLEDKLTEDLKEIRSMGAREAFARCLGSTLCSGRC